MQTPDIFLAGIIQGSLRELAVVSQDYRERIKRIVAQHAPDLSVYDPIANHPRALSYSTEQARNTFFGHLELVRRSRLLIAYLPEASLGTAIEMWEAYGKGIPVVSISPLVENWVVKLLSSVICRTLEEFGGWAAGNLEKLLGKSVAGRSGDFRAGGDGSSSGTA